MKLSLGKNQAARQKSKVTSRVLPIAAGLILGLCAEAANFEVTSEDNSGPGSLRDAIEQANALPGADSITFDPSVRDISLLATGLSITDALTITGRPEDPVVIRGEGVATSVSFRVFSIDDGTKAEQPVSLTGLEIRDGKISAIDGGAGIFNRENLTLQHVRVLDNLVTPDNDQETGLGGGILSSGPILVVDSLIAGNTLRSLPYGGGGFGRGGGLYGSSTTIVRRSTIRDNTVLAAGDSFGGGIAGTDLQVEESLIRDNIAVTAGNRNNGGVTAMGGGIHGMGTIRNSTISGNVADADPSNGLSLKSDASGGGVSLEGVVQNSTIVDNLAVATYYYLYPNAKPDGGGARIDGIIESSLVANNRTELRKAPYPVPSTSNDLRLSLFSVLRFNLISDPEGTFIPVGSVGNVFGAPAISGLADHGGPTLTHALLPGSQAIDAGINPAGLLIDQRGRPRVAGAATDIGAYESAQDFAPASDLFEDDFETGDLLRWSLQFP